MNIAVTAGRRGQIKVTVDGRAVRRWKSSSRNVYLDRKSGLVIKVDDSVVWRQSANEVRVWDGLSRQQRDVVAEVVAHGKVGSLAWVAQRYVPGRHPTEEEFFMYGLRVLFDFVGVHDAHVRNMILSKRGPVIVDYGSVPEGL